MDINYNINELNHRISFWTERLNEAIDSVSRLDYLADELKINMNSDNINEYTSIISVLNKELDRIQ